MVERLPKRLKAGPLEVEWPEVATEARVALATSPEAKALTMTDSLTERLAKVAADDPGAAVMAAWSEVERALRERSDAPATQHVSISGTMLAHILRQRGEITEATERAVSGLAVLRNLAVLGRGEQIDTEKALDYLTLADATLFAIRSPQAAKGNPTAT